MAEGGARKHVRAYGGNYLKLAAAIGALATAVNGYVDLQKNQEVLLQTLATRLNSLSAKVAYLEGRIGVDTPGEAPGRLLRTLESEGGYPKVPSTIKELRRAAEAHQEE
jgi:hypothetical protein